MKHILSIAALLFTSCASGNGQMMPQPEEESSHLLKPTKEMRDEMVAPPVTNSTKFVSGYWESFGGAINPGDGTVHDPSYYENDFKPMTHIFYASLTLDQYPNAKTPNDAFWNGTGLHDKESKIDIISLLNEAKGGPTYWQTKKINAMMALAKQNGQKWIWSIGGGSDLTKTIHANQTDAFVAICIDLLKIGGDGVDLDWKHESNDPQHKKDHLDTLAMTFLKLRTGLDAIGLKDKLLGYSTKYDAFIDDDSRPDGFRPSSTDGEGIMIDNALKAQNSTIKDVVSFTNIEFYNKAPKAVGAPDDGFTLKQYQAVFQSFEDYFDKDQIVMGFEPGMQYGGGKWEGSIVDGSVIDYVQKNGYGGVMFWAINETKEDTGKNVNQLATYAQKTFNPTSQIDLDIFLPWTNDKVE